MIKELFILGVLIGLLSFAYIVMTASPSDKKQYEAYMRWKERKRNDKRNGDAP